MCSESSYLRNNKTLDELITNKKTKTIINLKNN